MDVCRRFRISGRVQGVFFRASTAREAERLGLVGYAHNLPDGRVEVLAAGRQEAVDELQAWLAHGPPAAAVQSVQVTEEPMSAAAGLTDFRTG